MMEIVTAFYMLAIAISMGYLAIIVLVTRKSIGQYHLNDVAAAAYPPVSILKPIKGLDDRLEENLRSFFQLDYPRYEILFSLEDPADPARQVIENLQQAYPFIPSCLLINEHKIGLNPKINNLQKAYEKASHEYLLISDSNTCVDTGYLKEIMALMADLNTGLVTSAIRGRGARNMPSILENLHLNTYVLPNVFAVERIFKRPISIGKGMLIRKSTIEAIGGLHSFRNVLAEDYLMGRKVKELGMQVRTSLAFVDNINEKWSWSRFLNRHSRWAKMRMRLSTRDYLAEIMTNPLALSLILLLIRLDTWGIIQFALVMTVKMILDGYALKLIQLKVPWYHYLLIPLKDLIMALIWYVPFFSRRVNWRGNRFKIMRHTFLLPVSKNHI